MSAALLPILRCDGRVKGQRCPMEQDARDVPPGTKPIRTATDLRAALLPRGWTETPDGRDLCDLCSPNRMGY